MQGIAYQLGRLWASLNVATKLIAMAGCILALGWCAKPTSTVTPNAKASAGAVDPQAAAASASQARLQADCARRLPELRLVFEKAISRGRYTAAVASMEPCAQASGDSALLAAVKAAKLKATLAVVKDTNAQAGDRVRALHILQREFPDHAEPFASLEAPLSKRADRDTKTAEARKKRTEGVSLGMSQEDVLASNWGRPQHVNRTTNIHGTHEQWVYRGGYLYFDDGVLTSIQN